MFARGKRFNGQQWQDEFNLNVTAMDFRQYDNALGRFYSPDALSELTYDQTPYHFGFNNPAFWSDPTGLFSSWGAANDHKMRYGLANAQINYNADKGVYQIDNEGYSFYQVGSDIISMYATQADGVVVNIIKGGGASGVGPNGGVGNGNSFNNLRNDMQWSNGILGGISAGNVYTSGYLKYNELWHRTKTNGYSFATQGKWNNSGAKYWRGQQVKSFKSGRNIGKALTKVGKGLVVADIAMSGQVKPSHLINSGMLIASGTGVGSIAAGIWYIADYGTGAYNYIFTEDGFRTISDIIDETPFGQSITIDMYDGFY